MSTTPPATSLADLAARNQLPHHQFVDHATVRWIAANRPNLVDDAPTKIRETPRRFLARAAIPTAAQARTRDPYPPKP